MLPAPGGVSPVHLTDSVSKASYDMGATMVYNPADQPTIVQLIEEADETLFNNIKHNQFHILHPLLAKQIDYCYSLWPRSHNFELTHNHDNRNFIDRMLFRNRL